MTNERAIELLETGSRFPDTPHTAQELDEALELAVKAIRAQQEQTNEPVISPLKIGDTIHGMEIVDLDALAGTVTLSGWRPYRHK